jgi:TonB-linked SusC/RagA family outer membrane protein
VNFSLGVAATTLDQVVVTATGQTETRREQGVTSARINADTVQLAPIQNFSQLVQGRAAGVTITQSGGSVGQGATVRIRGANSLSLSNEPLLVIDGVRVESAPESQSIGVGGQTPSRLNDLNPEEIENIEILKGPAASTLYGTAAANGVIQVTTKRGRNGRAQWNAWVEGGASDQVWDIPDNFGGTNAAGDTTFGVLSSIASGDEEFGSLLQYNPLNESDIFRTGVRQQYGLSVAGGTNAVTYFVSGELDKENGIARTNESNRVNLRANIQTNPSDKLSIGFNTGYISTDLLQPQNDNNTQGILPQGLLGNPYNDDNGGFFGFDPSTTTRFRTEQDVERFLGSSTANFRPLSWLNLVGTAGLDVLQRDDNSLLPPNVIFLTNNDIIGNRTRNRYAISNYTATGTATATFELTPWLTSTTSGGGQFLRQNFSGSEAFGRNLLAGSGSLEGANEQFAVGEVNEDERTIGFYGRQQLGFNNRVFLTGAFRADKNSNFGENVGFVTYPQAEASWVVSEEGFFPQGSAQPAQLAAPAAAYGESGLAPDFRQAFRNYLPVAVRVNGAETPGFTINGAGNLDLEPEVIRETELGFDAGFFGGRLGLEFTYFSKKAEDAIFLRRLAPSLGLTTSQLTNLGELANWGTEWLLNANVLKRENFALDADGELQHAQAERERPARGRGAADLRPRRRLAAPPAGVPAGRVLRHDVHVRRRRRQRPLSDDEVTLSEEQTYLGTSEPRRVLGVQLNGTLFRNFRVSTLVDYRGGHKLFNSTEEFRCGFGICRGVNDPTASLDEQARAIAGVNGSIQGFVEDASFVRLREVSLTASLPTRLAQRAGARGASVSLAGRNLGLWTDYTGSDPEINFAGQANYSRAEFLSQPPVRSYSVRLNLTF